MAKEEVEGEEPNERRNVGGKGCVRDTVKDHAVVVFPTISITSSIEFAAAVFVWILLAIWSSAQKCSAQ